LAWSGNGAGNPEGRGRCEAADECRLQGAPNWPRSREVTLAKIKKRYDPTNLFRVNQNIKPAK
jgi:hypothetical protein